MQNPVFFKENSDLKKKLLLAKVEKQNDEKR